MSWHFSRALVEAFSAGRSSDGEPSAPWSLSPSAPDDSCSDKMKGTCHRSPFGTMYVPSTDGHGEGLLMSFRAAFPARTLALLGTAPGSTASKADSGEKWQGWFARWDREQSSWKTPQRSLLGGWAEFSETWPTWGSMRNGECYPRQSSAPCISEREFGYSLPTPGKNEYKGAGVKRFRGSPHFRGAKTAEGLRTSANDPIYSHPQFIEAIMGWPISWTGTAPLETAKFREWWRLHGGC